MSGATAASDCERSSGSAASPAVARSSPPPLDASIVSLPAWPQPTATSARHIIILVRVIEGFPALDFIPAAGRDRPLEALAAQTSRCLCVPHACAARLR